MLYGNSLVLDLTDKNNDITYPGYTIQGFKPCTNLLEEKASTLYTQQVPPEDLLLCIAYFHIINIISLFIHIKHVYKTII